MMAAYKQALQVMVRRYSSIEYSSEHRKHARMPKTQECEQGEMMLIRIRKDLDDSNNKHT